MMDSAAPTVRAGPYMSSADEWSAALNLIDRDYEASIEKLLEECWDSKAQLHHDNERLRQDLKNRRDAVSNFVTNIDQKKSSLFFLLQFLRERGHFDEFIGYAMQPQHAAFHSLAQEMMHLPQ